MNHLGEIWKNLASRYSSDDKLIRGLWNEMVAAYTGSKRFYHNLGHIKKMIEYAFAFKEHLDHFDTVVFAIFYHDLVHRPLRKDNVENSADAAARYLSRLGVTPAIIERCTEMIIA